MKLKNDEEATTIALPKEELKEMRIRKAKGGPSLKQQIHEAVAKYLEEGETDD